MVRGGPPLRGTLPVHGAKNSALKLMAAALLGDGESVIDNVPAISDVPVMAELLEALGAGVVVEGDRVRVRPQRVHWRAPAELCGRIRASITLLGPLVARCRRASLPLPGGDAIGARSIDMHLRGLTGMGARVTERGDRVEVVAPDLRGADITLDFPSVGATENLLLAAVLATGRTVIDNAAREPEVVDLCRMLTAMGARIEGAGSPRLVIHGVEGLSPVGHRTVPDRIEAGTLAVAAALTGGDVTLTGVCPDDLHLPLLKLRAAGALVEEGEGQLRIKGGELRAVDVVTLPYPGFPTDLQPQLMVLLSQAQGTSICTENVFESRFAFVDELLALGADIHIDGHHAVIRGPTRLRGATLRALDVRAGAAAVLAGLVATGTTVVTDVHHVDRGYSDLVGRLRALGADLSRAVASGHGG